MRRNVFLVFVVALLGCGSVLTGCHREGPAERAGKSVDRAADRTGDSLERAGDRAKDRLER